MEQVYHWIGFIIFWLVAPIATLSVLFYWLMLILEEVLRICDVFYVVLEYARNRRAFKKWSQREK